jgi:hypothetical protein
MPPKVIKRGAKRRKKSEAPPPTPEVQRPWNHILIDVELCYKLARIQCTIPEICDIAGVSNGSFYNYCKAHPEFAKELKKARADGKVSLRRQLYIQAMKPKPDSRILVHVSKAILNNQETEKVDVTSKGKQLPASFTVSIGAAEPKKD